MADDTTEAMVTGGDTGRKLRARAHEAGFRAGPSGAAVPEVAGTADDEVNPAAAALELHVCMGLNSCQGHDRLGTAPMAGMGQCATVFHVCHGDNNCRGQGGCGYAGSDVEQGKPGNQSCKWNGSCASPINETRRCSAGPQKGKSVWRLARAIFEERMYDAGVPFGPAPGTGWPDDLVPSYEAGADTGCPPPR